MIIKEEIDKKIEEIAKIRMENERLEILQIDNTLITDCIVGKTYLLLVIKLKIFSVSPEKYCTIINKMYELGYEYINSVGIDEEQLIFKRKNL